MMSKTKNSLAIVLTVMVCLLWAGTCVSAGDSDDDDCFSICTFGAGRLDPDPDPLHAGFDVSTMAAILDGPLQGTTKAGFDFTGPSTFVGLVTFTTVSGDTLTLNPFQGEIFPSFSGIVGIDGTADFEGSGTVSSSSNGVFEDAHGSITIKGTQFLTEDGTFFETLTGVLCHTDDSDD